MRQYPLEKNVPSLSYIINNWPRSKFILRKFILSKYSSPNLFKICELCMTELKVFRKNQIFDALKRQLMFVLLIKHIIVTIIAITSNQ